MEAGAKRSREIAREVLLEAVGASATPFVPVPFVDDMLLARVLRRVAKKVLVKHGIAPDPTAKALVNAYVDAGAAGVGASILTAGVRFVVRKVAVVMDVKKSHDVFGEAIALALAVDAAASAGVITPASAAEAGATIHRALGRVGSGPIEGLVRAGREAWTRSGADKSASRMEHVAEAIGVEVDRAREHIEAALDFEWSKAR